MFTSFSTALSALSAQSTAVDVVGNNLANLNTVGFKGSAVSFHDLVSQSLGTGDTQVGSGVGRPSTVRQFVQGSIQATSGSLDAAIQGDGFFVLKDQSNGLVFSRAGNFQVDASGNLLSNTKQRVQGWTEVNGVVDPNTAVGDIKLPVGALRPPFPSTQLSVNMNLNAAAVTGTPDAAFSTPIEVVDSLGASHVVTMKFTKSATVAGSWDYDVTVPGADVTGGTAGTPKSIKTGTVTFDANGQLKTPASTAPTVTLPIAGLVDGATDLSIEWALYDANLKPRLTQFSQPSAVSANAQNGSPAAQLLRIGLADGGKILAQFSNGTQQVVGQVALASIRNPESLIGAGNNNLQVSADTALPAIGAADTGGRGKISGGSLEGSTVDIAREFTNLIVFQRGYQANAKVITTVDELSQDTINLKR